MLVDLDATPDLLLLIQQKLRIVQYRYGSIYPHSSGIFLGAMMSICSLPYGHEEKRNYFDERKLLKCLAELFQMTVSFTTVLEFLF